MYWTMTRADIFKFKRFYLFNGFQNEPAEWSHYDIEVVFKRFCILFVEIAEHLRRTIMSPKNIACEKNLSVLFPRSNVSPSFTTRDLNGIFTISSRYLIALPLPTTVAEGARSKRSLRLPE